MGMFAARALQVGERVIAERPLARWLVRTAESREGKLRSFAKVVESLDEPSRAAFLGLSQATHHVGEERDGARGVRTMMGTWLTNALPINYENSDGTHEEAAVFATICRLNHACVPNAHHEWNDELGMETVHALRPIARGEELTISYLLPAGRPRDERQQMLSQQFGFVCGCALCGLDGAARERSDTCQRAIGTLTGEKDVVEGPAEAARRLDVRLSLMEREGLPLVWARPLLLAAMVHSARDDPTDAGRERAAKLHARAVEAMRISTGTDHPNYRVIASFFDTLRQFDGAMGAFARATAPPAPGSARTASGGQRRAGNNRRAQR